jgi:hypothetical protein
MMNLSQIAEQIRQLENQTENSRFKKTIARATSLLKEILSKNITDKEKEEIQSGIGPYLQDIQSPSDLSLNLKKVRVTLIEDFGFVPLNYYLTPGIGIGLALGSALGITLGIPFENGIVFGPMIGSGLGLLVGLVVGMYLDKKKETANRTLKNL